MPEATETVYLRLPTYLKATLRDLADEHHGGNMSEALRQLLENYRFAQLMKPSDRREADNAR